MEHRFGQRLHLRLGIQVYLDHLPKLVALTRNVSWHGLNLALTHPELMRNRMVKIELAESGGTSLWQTWALVVHASEKGGTGLALEDSLPENLYNADQIATG